MLRGTRAAALFVLVSAAACGSGRQFSSRDSAGAAGMEPGSGGSRSGAGGKSTGGGGDSKGGSDPGRAGTSGSGSAEGGSAAEAAGGRSSAGGTRTGGGGEDEGGNGAVGEGGDDAGGTGAVGEGGNGASGGAPVAGSGGTSTGGGGVAGSATGGAGSGGGGGQLGGCDNQLLANADFDAGPSPSWQEEVDLSGLELIVHRNDAELMAAGVAPHSGDYLAWLGGIADNEFDHHVTILRQEVTIPADANTLTLSGRYWITTADSTTVAYDEAYLEFEDDEGLVWQALPLTNVDHTTGWTAFEEYTNDMERLAGHTLTFLAYARTDPEGMTSFFLDSLRLEADCGR